ncbi:hypothetical protein V6N11_074782 [Hibiscus sabdariffa]|uniref:Uncharacterized protein n=1 Tax=Hibiscus sabdariffa TaxID=183260 RepID=A0ABR2R587_9ROSI
MLPFSHGALLDLDFLSKEVMLRLITSLPLYLLPQCFLQSALKRREVYNPQQSQSWLYVFSSLVFGNGEHSACRNLNCWCHALSLLHLSHGVQFRPILNILCIVVCSGFVTLPVLLKSAGYNS